MNFERLKFEHKELFNGYLTDPDYYGCNLDFAGAMIWNIREEACFAEEDGVFYTLACFDGTPVFFPPLTRDPKADLTEAFRKMAAHAAEKGYAFLVKGITPEMLTRVEPALKSKYKICRDRPFFDYVYSAEELIALPGKKFHGKRNHLNQFLYQYKFDYREYRPEDYEGVMALCDAWAAENGDPAAAASERAAIVNGIKNMESLELFGGVILIDGAIRAFTLGGYNNFKDMGIVYFEKGDTSYRGIYPAINNFFVKHRYADCRFVNRQEDMGIPGLRKAKLSYNPVFLVEKYTMTNLAKCPVEDEAGI